MLEEAKNIYNKVPSWMRNRYFISLLLFGLALVFFDENNVFRLMKRKKNLRELHQQEKFYNQELKELDVEINALKNDRESLEKFAREEYRMKKDNEDIFIIVDEKRNVK